MNSPTEAVLFRTKGTIGIDEFETLASKEKQSIRELLNTCYKKGTKVMRMKRKKTSEGDEQVVEEFEPYRPVVLANIWGIEEVLGDRCISVILEKSNSQYYTKLIEDFSEKPEIKRLLKVFQVFQCSLCSVVSSRGMITTWNQYVRDTYLYLHTQTTQTTYKYTNNTNLTQEEINFCKKIDETNLNGRHLELYFPLFLIAKEISSEVFNEVLNIAKKSVELRRVEEQAENKDVLVYKLVSNQAGDRYYKIQELTTIFKLMIGEGEADWITSHWLGRSLKRLNLINSKKRMGDGVHVMLNVNKALEKWEMFK
jgi:hypothetical protein